MAKKEISLFFEVFNIKKDEYSKVKKLFKKYGIGIIEVNNEKASLLLKGKKHNPIDTPSMDLIKRKIRENYQKDPNFLLLNKKLVITLLLMC